MRAPGDFGPLVESAWLEEHLQKENLRIFDTTSFLIPVPGAPYRIKSGIEEFLRGHIPGAGFLDLNGELSNRASPLPFMMPSAEQFGAVVSEKGVSNDSWVALYSKGNMMWSTRVWWMFISFGFDRVAVLDGGWDKWQRESRPVSSRPCAYHSGTFTATSRPDLIANRQEVERAIGESGVCTLCTLSPEVYQGTSKRHSGRPGHIPGSLNDYYRNLVDPDTGTFLDPADLRERFATLGVFEKDRIITYCGGGIASTLTALALRLAGHQDVAVYDGSLREWAADPKLPLEL